MYCSMFITLHSFYPSTLHLTQAAVVKLLFKVFNELTMRGGWFTVHVVNSLVVNTPNWQQSYHLNTTFVESWTLRRLRSHHALFSPALSVPYRTLNFDPCVRLRRKYDYDDTLPPPFSEVYTLY